MTTLDGTPSRYPQALSARYVAYFRVSTRKQGQSGLGLQAQRHAVEDFLQSTGGEVITEYIEVESGKRDDRPEFIKAADYAELANATLLVAKLDRLSRDLHFITGLQKRGIRFKLCDLPEVDQLTIHILAAMAQHKARMISQRTKQAMRAAKARGQASTLGDDWLYVYLLLEFQSSIDKYMAVRVMSYLGLLYLVAALFRLEHNRDEQDMLRVLGTLVEWLRASEQRGLRRAFVVWIRRVLLPNRAPGMELPEFNDLQDLQKVHNMLAERIKKWP